MKKNKGFTLIELLAIIVILAIIAVITVPIILNIIENSKKGAAVDSAYGYKEAIHDYYLTKLSEDIDYQLNGSYTVSDGKLTSENEEGATLTHAILFSGTKPTSGNVEITNGVITSACLVVDEYKVELQNGAFTTSGKGTCPESSGDTSIIGKKVKLGDEYFYVISYNDTDVTLLAQYNLYVGYITEHERVTVTQPSGSSYETNKMTLLETISEDTPGYAMQNSTASGQNTYTNEKHIITGTVRFSNRPYWLNNCNSEHGFECTFNTDYNNLLYDPKYNANNTLGFGSVSTPYAGANEDDNYSVAYYVEKYKQNLIDLGLNVTSARMLTKDEAESLKDIKDNEKSIITNGMTFWLATHSQSTTNPAGVVSLIYFVYSSADETGNSLTSSNMPFSYDYVAGVRPVIEVPRSELNLEI